MACWASSGIEALEFSLGLFMLEMGRPRLREDRGEFRPGIRRAHIDNTNCLNPRLRRLDAEQGRGLAVLDTAPKSSARR